jgi:hypothetical protein
MRPEQIDYDLGTTRIPGRAGIRKHPRHSWYAACRPNAGLVPRRVPIQKTQLKKFKCGLAYLALFVVIQGTLESRRIELG